MKYLKPKLYSAKYALHGPCVNNKTYLILEADKGDVEPNCKAIATEEGWEFMVNYTHSSILKIHAKSILHLITRN